MSTKRLSRSESEPLPKSVVHCYSNVVNGNKLANIKYFPEEGYSLRTLYKIIKRYTKEGSTTHLSKLGRPKSKKQRDISRKVVKHLFKN